MPKNFKYYERGMLRTIGKIVKSVKLFYLRSRIKRVSSTDFNICHGKYGVLESNTSDVSSTLLSTVLSKPSLFMIQDHIRPLLLLEALVG